MVFALGVLAPRDMAWLWDQIVAVAREHGVVAGGDSACGFANTAMQLAGQGMLPESEEQVTAHVLARYGDLFAPTGYDL